MNRADSSEATEGARAALQARTAVEDVITLLTQVPVEFDRAPVAESLRRLIHLLYVVIDSGPDSPAHVEGLIDGAAVAGEVRSGLRGIEERGRIAPLDQAIDRLKMAESALRLGLEASVQQPLPATRRAYATPSASSSSGPPGRGRELVASVGAAELHAIPRAPLIRPFELDPVVKVEAAPVPPSHAAPAAPRTLDELAAMKAESAASVAARFLQDEPPPTLEEEPPEPILGFVPAQPEMEVLRRMARDCLEDIAIFRDLRKPNELEGWIDQAPFEQRLLDNLDAFAAVGPVALTQVAPFCEEAASPDPGRAFAAAFALGCVEGRDTVDTAVGLLLESAPETHPGWVEGWALASNPHVDIAMLELLEQGPADVWPVALEVLCLRRSHPPHEVLEKAARDAPPPARAALARALGFIGEREGAVILLEGMLGAEPNVRVTAVEALLRRGHPPARGVLRAWVAAADTFFADEAAWRLAMAGDASDLDALLTRMRASPLPRTVRGLGRFGHMHAIGGLLELLTHTDEETVLAAAESLERITGAGLVERVQVPWELDVAEELLARGAPPPQREVERPITDVAVWDCFLRENGHRFAADVRYRGGVPFHPSAIVDELEAPRCPPDRREEAELEAAIATGIATSFWPGDWVVRQQAKLDELRRRVVCAGLEAGQWGFARRRSDGPGPAEVVSSSHLSKTVTFSLTEVLARAAMPFSTKAPAAPVAPPAAPDSKPGPSSRLGATQPPSTARNAAPSQVPVLPFRPSSQSSAPPAPAPPAAALPPRTTKLDRTMPSDAGRGIPPSVMPFRESAPPDPHAIQPPPPTRVGAVHRPPSAPGMGDTKPSFGPAGNPLPFLPSVAAPASARPRAPSITIDQYAWLISIEKIRPAEYRALRARVGLADDAAWKSCDREFNDRLERDHGLRHHFGRLLVTYQQWLAKE